MTLFENWILGGIIKLKIEIRSFWTQVCPKSSKSVFKGTEKDI